MSGLIVTTDSARTQQGAKDATDLLKSPIGWYITGTLPL